MIFLETSTWDLFTWAITLLGALFTPQWTCAHWISKLQPHPWPHAGKEFNLSVLWGCTSSVSRWLELLITEFLVALGHICLQWEQHYFLFINMQSHHRVGERFLLIYLKHFWEDSKSNDYKENGCLFSAEVQGSTLADKAHKSLSASAKRANTMLKVVKLEQILEKVYFLHSILGCLLYASSYLCQPVFRSLFCVSL